MKSPSSSLALLVLVLTGSAALSESTSPRIRFQFREPGIAAYQVEANQSPRPGKGTGPEWVRAWPEDGSTNHVELGRRVVLHLRSAGDLARLLQQSPLRLARTVTENVFILQADDAWAALAESQRLAALPEVLASYPVTRRAAALHGAYSYKPNDPYFYVQWYLEHRTPNAAAAGIDLNVRAAWPYTEGAGVTLAVADVGVELSHPELALRVLGAPHYNFSNPASNATPSGSSPTWAHGTEVAGLAVAEANNGIGMAGVAPLAHLASWAIFTTNLLLVSDEQLMEMYQFSSNTVSIQNHSWGRSGITQLGPTPLEKIGISNAVAFGRNGRGVVMLRAAGNDRGQGANANDDGYPSDPRVIAVGAARFDGRVTTYSEPGACVLVAAPSGDTGFSNSFFGLFTTDLLGARGVNQIHWFGDTNLWDYAFDALGFTGTSASTPLVAGVAALILSANPTLGYRDVQQILIHSARHFDLADPGLTTNGAGFRVSHNQGFGVPDAGWAVTLARSWPNRPPLTNVTVFATNLAAIPDDGLRLLITGKGVPASLASIQCLSGTGPHPDVPTASLPFVYVGLATNSIPIDLTGKAALIVRGTNLYPDKITFAAQAGAAFAVIYNHDTSFTNGCPGGDGLCLMAGSDFTSIPAVFIGNTDGEAIKSVFQTNTDARAQLRLNSTNYIFTVTNTLICEHVGVRVMTDHTLRGDVRITLVSPQGTRSVLQAYNADLSAGPVDWTYYSTHHFYESSAGNWTVSFSDESPGFTGNVQYVALTIEGVPIVDSDRDGLDDGWEMAHFGSLDYGPKDDPDGDGYSNAREQIMGTDPMVSDIPFALDLSRWNPSLARLSWPGGTNKSYQVWSGTNVTSLLLLTNVPGTFPVTEWFTPYPRPTRHFFQVRTLP